MTNGTKKAAVVAAVLAAVECLRQTGGRGARGRAHVAIADLRDRLLQMSARELDAALLGLEEQGRVRLVPAVSGEGSYRDRMGALVCPSRGPLAYVAHPRPAALGVLGVRGPGLAESGRRRTGSGSHRS